MLVTSYSHSICVWGMLKWSTTTIPKFSVTACYPFYYPHPNLCYVEAASWSNCLFQTCMWHTCTRTSDSMGHHSQDTNSPKKLNEWSDIRIGGRSFRKITLLYTQNTKLNACKIFQPYGTTGTCTNVLWHHFMITLNYDTWWSVFGIRCESAHTPHINSRPQLELRPPLFNCDRCTNTSIHHVHK